MCNNCGNITNDQVGVNTNGADVREAPETPISTEFLDMYTAALYAGIVTQYTLSTELYTQTAGYLEKGLLDGFGSDLTDPSRAELFRKLRTNTYHFSAAKQYTQNREILSSFVAPLEQIPFKDFKEVADSILKDYNKNYLKTEWKTAVAQSQSARDWNELMQDETVTYIEYITQEDGRVRPEHARLNRARYPKTSSFWNSYFPPNGWNCRCFTVNYDQDTTPNPIENPPKFSKDNPEMPPAFNTNPGKTGIIYPNSHPYFRVAQGDKVFREINYGMPLPQ